MGIKKIIQKIFIIFIFLPILCFPSEILAETMNYHPDLHFKLGSTFDPDNPSDGKRNALIIKDANPTYGPGISDDPPVSTRISIHEVQDYSELYESLGISSDLAIRYGSFKGQASFKLQKNIKISSNSIAWVINIGHMYPPLFLKDQNENIQLIPDAKELLKDSFLRNPDFATFKDVYGTQYISSVRMGVMISVVLNIKNESVKKVNKIRAEINASKKGGALGVKSNNALEHYIKEAQARNEFNLKVIANGKTDALAGLIDLEINDGAITISRIKDIIKKFYLENCSKESGFPMQYSTSNLVGLANIADPFSLYEGWKTRKLNKLHKVESVLVNNLDKIGNAILYSEAFNINADSKLELEKQSRTINKLLDRIENVKHECINYMPGNKFDGYKSSKKCDFDSFTEYILPEPEKIIKKAFAYKETKGNELYLNPLQINYYFPMSFSVGIIRVYDESKKQIDDIGDISLSAESISNIQKYQGNVKIRNLHDGFVPCERNGLDGYNCYHHYWNYVEPGIEAVCVEGGPYYDDTKCRKKYADSVKAARKTRIDQIQKPKYIEIILTNYDDLQEFRSGLVPIEYENKIDFMERIKK